MKITYLHQYFKLPSESGSTRSFDLATSFISDGHEVKVITTTSNSKFRTKKRWSIVYENNLEIHYLYLPYSNQFSFLKRSVVFAKFMFYSTARLLYIKSDIVIATSTPLTIGVPAVIKKILHNTPYIFEVRDVWPEAVIAIGAIKNKVLQKGLYGLEKLIYKNAVAIVPLSTDMRKSIVRRYPELSNKTEVVVENIAEISRFGGGEESFNLESFIGIRPRFSVLYAGTFGLVNGIHKIVELAEMTLRLDKSLVFILIGSGAEKSAVLELAKSKGVLNNNVFVLDSISKNELPKWYNAVSMGSSFVIEIPELWANSANKFFDSLAASKPILINYEGWQADIIRRHNVGYVLPTTITEKAAIDFCSFTRNVDLLKIQGSCAFNLAKNQYSLEKATEKYLKILRNFDLEGLGSD